MIVLHVVESFSTGTLQALRVICLATEGEVTNHILHGSRDEGVCARPVGFPASVSFIPWPVGREISFRKDVRAIAVLRETVAWLRPDRIHAHSSKAGALVRIAFLGGRIPLFYSPHGYSFLRRDLSWLLRFTYWSIERLLGFVPHVTVACGTEEYVRARSVSRSVVYIPNMLDLTSIDVAMAALDLPVAFPKSRTALLVGTAGGIRPQKNFSLFCAVATSLRETGMRFLWVGGGEIPPSVVVPENLEVTGWCEHAETLSRLAACDVYMQTSLWEGLSIAVLEGMALGLPILATPAPGNIELVIDGYNGYLCSSVNDFVSRLDDLSKNSATLVAFGAASRRMIEQGFTLTQLAPRWRSLYRHYVRYRCYG